MSGKVRKSVDFLRLLKMVTFGFSELRENCLALRPRRKRALCCAIHYVCVQLCHSLAQLLCVRAAVPFTRTTLSRSRDIAVPIRCVQLCRSLAQLSAVPKTRYCGPQHATSVELNNSVRTTRATSPCRCRASSDAFVVVPR